MKWLDFQSLQRLKGWLEHVDVGEYIVEGDLEAYSCKLAGLDKKLSKSLEVEVQASSPAMELSASPVGPLSDSSSRKTLIYLILTLNHIYPDYDFSLLRAQNFKKLDGLGRAEETIDSHLLEVSKVRGKQIDKRNRVQGGKGRWASLSVLAKVAKLESDARHADDSRKNASVRIIRAGDKLRDAAAAVWSNAPVFSDQPFLESLWGAIDEAIDLKDSDVYCYESDLETDPFGEKTTIWSFNYFFYNRKLKRMLYLSCRALSKSSAEGEEDTESSARGAFEADTDADPAGMANDMDNI